MSEIDTLVFGSLDAAVESASSSLLIACTSDSSVRRPLCSRVEEPMDNCMLDHLIVVHLDPYRTTSSFIST